MIHKIEHVDDGFVRVHKQSCITGNHNSMVLPTRQGELEHWEENMILVQDAFPHFTSEQREFLISGSTPNEWNKLFSEETQCL